MHNDQNDEWTDAFSATDLSRAVDENLVKFESKSPQDSSSPSRQSQNSSHDLLHGIRQQAKALKPTIEKRKQNDAAIPKDELWNEIMKRMSSSLTGQDDLISTEKIDEIGMALITSYCSLELAARKCDISVARLKWLIANVPELEVYFEIAHEGIKTFTDAEIIKRLRAGDDEILKIVFNKLYSGRAKGGYNPSEIGTTGYNDKLGKRLAAETERDRGKGTVQVQFNFIQKEIREDFGPIEVEGQIIDADEVGDDD